MNDLQTTVSQVRQHSRQLVREVDLVKGIYLDTGCSFSQCHVLFELSRNRSLSLMELAEQLLIDKSNTSRTVKKLVQMGLVRAEKSSSDKRQKFFRLSPQGKKVLSSTIRLADRQVRNALTTLSDDQQETVVEGMQLYANALRKSRLQGQYAVRRIRKPDNAQVARLIRSVMTEFQAVGKGYSIGDSEVDDMHGSYRNRRSCYYVIAHGEQIVGCGGIAPLAGGDRYTCELRKMFFEPAIRGLGLGRRLLLLLMDKARERAYKRCYIETLERMWRANELYSKNGFQLLDGPIGNTGHGSCNRWYLLDL